MANSTNQDSNDRVKTRKGKEKADDNELNTKKRPKIDPCTNCRYVYPRIFSSQRHLKCDYESIICKRCERNGEKCVRGRTKIKFRHGSSARYDSGFSKDQTWIKPSGSSENFKYVDETDDLVAYYAHGGSSPNESDDEDISNATIQNANHTTNGTGVNRSMGPPSPVQSILNQEPSSPLKRRKTIESKTFESDLTGSLPSISPALSFLNLHSPSAGGRLSFSASGDAATPFDYASLLGLSEQDLNATLLTFDGDTSLRPNSSSFHGPFREGLVKQPSPRSERLSSNRLQAILLRYFVDVLAKWFDLCDPEKHFELVVPQRARSSPPLFNAICTASARHLTRLEKYKDATGEIVWDGQRLPDLTVETALHHQNECIKDLIRMSMDPEQVHDENLLAAAIILRFYEEVDAPQREDGDSELFLRVSSIFINAQAPEIPSLPHSSPEVYQSAIPLGFDSTTIAISPSSNSQPTPPATGIPQTPTFSSISTASNVAPRPTRHDGLRQACFWIAFRQEVHSAFMKQRPFTMPLSRCEEFRSFTPAEDAVWADRLIIFCADVLDFCYGSTQDARTIRDRWTELKQQEQTWSRVLPSTFEPIYFEEPSPKPNMPLSIFPQIWHLADFHVAGLQHVELARILLTVYDPTRPKLGPGHVAGMKAMATELKTAVMRLCGMALSNRRTPPGLVTAAMGITMCGEHFEDRLEQMALLAVLDELESQHAWPASDARDALIKEWGWLNE